LLHGNAAHADWYSFVAPLLAHRFRVAAMSWSGMGGSAWRSRYGVELHALEAIAVAREAGLFEGSRRPLLVAHSFGTFPLMAAAALHGELLGGAVLVDSPLRSHERRHAAKGAARRREWRAPSTYASLSEALARFRLDPPQPCEHLCLVDHVARESLKRIVGEQGETRWAWRFDPFMFRDYEFALPELHLSRARCPITLVRGEFSTVADQVNFAYARDTAPPGTRCREIAAAHHHVMLDQPRSFAELVQSLAEG
jgi:pimeloyl-ACP methyl ester carboxylesterase